MSWMTDDALKYTAFESIAEKEKIRLWYKSSLLPNVLHNFLAFNRIKVLS